MKTSNKIIKKLNMILIIAAVLFAGCFAASLHESYGAGTHSVHVKFDPNEGYTIADDTTYKLYIIGTFGENGVFDFIEPYKSNIDEVPNYKETDDEWAEKWLASAETVADYIKQNSIEPIDRKVAGDAESREGFSFTGLENGFYLVTGTSTRVVEKGKATYYWPRPMIIRILNDDPDYELKPAHGVAGLLRVLKQWSGDDDCKNKTRPDKIKVHIYYDNEEREQAELSDKNNWCYDWETEMGEDDPERWSVAEEQTGKVKQFYEVSYSEKFVENNDTMVMTITNKCIYKHKPVYIDPPVKKVVIGTPQKEGIYKFKLEAEKNSYPMPAEANGKSSMTMTIRGEGEKEFGKIYFRKPGVYKYIVTEVEGSDPDCEYDDTVYTVTARVTKDSNGDLHVKSTYTRNGKTTKAAVFKFINKYEDEPGPDKPKTGDFNHIMVYVALLAAAVVLLVIIVAAHSKKR